MYRLSLIAVLFAFLGLVSCRSTEEYSGSTVLEWHDSLQTNPKKVFFYYEKDDLNNGLIKQYRKDSTLKYEIPITNGKEHGEVRVYFSNDSLNFKAQYKFGLKDGVMESYNSHGELISMGNYIQDKKDGEWRYYNSEGQIIRTEAYKADSLLLDNAEN